MSQDEYNKELLDSYLADYYAHLYPVKLICNWLSYGNVEKDYLKRREIAFIFENDKHHRYQTFKFPHELQSELIKKRPHKIDIGAVYNVPAETYKSVPDFRPVERELVFDIDLTDYDNVRSCCNEANVCNKCWKFIVIAARVLNVILNKHFGFKHMLLVFSGRRGMHCWVGDKAARKLENGDRSAIAAYLTFRLNELPFDNQFMHPYAEDAYRAILDSPEIDEIVVEQEWLDDDTAQRLVEKYCSDETTRKLLLKIFNGTADHAHRWKVLKETCDEKWNKIASDQGHTVLKTTIELTMFLHSFLLDRLNPRLDSNVSTATNHLLKSPFCIHPKTGSIAIPFSLEEAGEFRLEDVPRVDQLVAELKASKENAMDTNETINCKPLAYKHGALKPAIEVFEKFINDILADKNAC